MEDIIKSYEIDVFRRVFLIHCFDILQHFVGDIGKLIFIIPLLIEYLQICFCCR